MAPMAGGVTDAEQDWNIAPLRFLMGFRSPGPPIDGLVGMLSQVKRAGILKSVWQRLFP